MGDLVNFLSGKKTYIVAVIAGITAFVQAMGWHIPEYVYVIEGALGLGSVRLAISKSGGNYVTADQVKGPLADQ